MSQFRSFISTRGYGILWNTASTSLFDNRYPNQLNLVASAATGLDYYFFYGPDADQIVHQYRQLTGTAPALCEMGYGFFQSKDRYSSQDQLLKVVEDYRSKHIPVDTIVQDWFWWEKQGDPKFKPRYPIWPRRSSGSIRRITLISSFRSGRSSIPSPRSRKRWGRKPSHPGHPGLRRDQPGREESLLELPRGPTPFAWHGWFLARRFRAGTAAGQSIDPAGKPPFSGAERPLFEPIPLRTCTWNLRELARKDRSKDESSS